MTDPGVKIAMALCVLAAGMIAASICRWDRPQPAPPSAEEDLALRCRAAPAAPAPTLKETVASVESRPAVVVGPSALREPPPSLSPDYPKTHRSAESPWKMPMAMMPPMAPSPDAAARTHLVVDGDTLQSLAFRYLGSSARADELFRANRDVLTHPNLLPIGVELKLPGR